MPKSLREIHGRPSVQDINEMFLSMRGGYRREEANDVLHGRLPVRDTGEDLPDEPQIDIHQVIGNARAQGHHDIADGLEMMLNGEDDNEVDPGFQQVADFEDPYERSRRLQAEEQKRYQQEQARRGASQDQRNEDPFGDVTMDSQGNPQWRYGAPHVGPRVIDETLRGLDDVPGPQRMITGPYRDYRDQQMGNSGIAPPAVVGGPRRLRGGGPGLVPKQQPGPGRPANPDGSQLKNPNRAPGAVPKPKISANHPALIERSRLHRELLDLRKAYDSAPSKQKERILEEIRSKGNKIADIDTWLKENR